MTESSTPRPIALGLDHINIATPRLAESRDFYVEVLGLQEGPRPPFEFDGYWLYGLEVRREGEGGRGGKWNQMCQ